MLTGLSGRVALALPRGPQPRSPSTLSVCSRASSPAPFRARQVYAPESAAWSPSRSRELPSGDILGREDGTVSCLSIPKHAHRAEMLCAWLQPRLQVLGCAARPRQRLGPWQGDRGHDRLQHHLGHQGLTRDDVPQQTAGIGSSQPEQGKRGGAAELRLPCTALLHMGKLRHAWGKLRYV